LAVLIEVWRRHYDTARPHLTLHPWFFGSDVSI
jgi:hypothetical protein